MARKRSTSKAAESVKSEPSDGTESVAGGEDDAGGPRKSSRARVAKFSVLEASGKKPPSSRKRAAASPKVPSPKSPPPKPKEEPAPDIPDQCKPPVGKDKPYKCNKCPLICTTEADFVRHYGGHGAGRTLACRDCDFSSDLPNAAEQHARLHKIAKKVQQEKTKQKRPPPETKGAFIAVPPDSERRDAYGGITYQCDKCPMNIQRRDCFATHYAGHGANRAHKCPYCDFSSKCLTGMRKHARLHSAFAKPASGSFLELNMRKTSEDKEEDADALLLECKHCPMKSTKPAHMRAHVAGHKRATGYKCPHCTYRSEFYGILTKHTKLHDNEDGSLAEPEEESAETKSQNREILSCSHCSFGSDSVATLRKHLRLHGVKKKRSPVKPSRPSSQLRSTPRTVFACPSCRFLSTATAAAAAHRRLHRKASWLAARRSLRCSRCTFSVHRDARPVLTHHRLHHHPQPPSSVKHRCGECGLAFATRAQHFHHRIQIHGAVVQRRRSAYRAFPWKDVRGRLAARVPSKVLREKKEKKLGCTECPYRCAQRAELVKHRSHHILQGSHQCNRCSFSSGSSQSLSHHLRMHYRSEKADVADFKTLGAPPLMPQLALPLEPRLLVCPTCPFSTRLSRELRRHRKRHDCPAKFRCSHCSFSINRASTLAQHLRLHETAAAEAEAADGLCMELEPVLRDAQGRRLARLATDTKRICCLMCSFETESGESLMEHSATHADGAAAVPELRVETASPSLSNSEVLATSSKRRLELYPSPTGQEAPSVAPDDLACDHCPHRASNQTMLLIHRKFHRGSRPFRCPVCTFNAHHAESLRHHLELHGRRSAAVPSPVAAASSGVSEKRWRCPHCSFRTRSSELMVTHQAGHLQELRAKPSTPGVAARNSRGNPQRHGWGRVGLGQISASTIAGRVKQMESQRYLLYYCPKCSFQCEFAGNMWKHVLKHGAKEGAYMCDYCDYSSKLPDVLMFHEQNHHSHLPFSALAKMGAEAKEAVAAAPAPPPVLQCAQCDFRGETAAEMDAHWKTHFPDADLLAALGLKPIPPPPQLA